MPMTPGSSTPTRGTRHSRRPTTARLKPPSPRSAIGPSSSARDGAGGYRAETASAVIVKRARKLLVGVHNERAVPRDGLADGLATHDVDVERGRIVILRGVGSHPYRVTGAEDRELAHAHGPLHHAN